MTIEHSNITDPEIHEPKGVATASANDVYVADGAGSGSWEVITPHGGWRYTNIGTGTTFTAPTSYTLMNVAGATTHLHYMTNNGAGRLTYTGTPDRHLHAVIDASFKHSSGAGVDVYFAVYKNGALLTLGDDTEVVGTADSGNYQRMVVHFDDVASSNDYYEVWLKCASGNVIVHAAYMFLMGMPG